MSRPPFWQPGDRWQPPITRIHGVEAGTPEALALMRRHEGAVKQFYLGQARAHALGVADNSRGRKQLPGVTMQYTNMQGQEILDVVFAPEYVESTKPAPKVRAVPRYVLMEVSIPEQPMTMYGSFMWRVRSPDTAPGRLSDPIPFYPPPPRTASKIYENSWYPDDRSTLAAENTAGMTSVTQMVTRSAAWADLSDFARSGVPATIELYGLVERAPMRTEAQIGTISAWTFTRLVPSTVGPLTDQEVDYLVQTIDTGGGSFLPYITGSLTPIGGGFFDYETISWHEFFYHNPQFVGKRLGLQTAGHIALNNGVWVNSIFYEAYQHDPDASGSGLIWLEKGGYMWVEDGPFEVPGWRASAVYNTDPMTIDVRGLVTDWEPAEGFVEEVSAVNSIRPGGHPPVGFNAEQSMSTAWADRTGARVDVPRVAELTVPTYDVFEGNLEFNYNVGSPGGQVSGLQYLGDYRVILAERSITFHPAD